MFKPPLSDTLYGSSWGTSGHRFYHRLHGVYAVSWHSLWYTPSYKTYWSRDEEKRARTTYICLFTSNAFVEHTRFKLSSSALHSVHRRLASTHLAQIHAEGFARMGRTTAWSPPPLSRDSRNPSIPSGHALNASLILARHRELKSFKSTVLQRDERNMDGCLLPRSRIGRPRMMTDRSRANHGVFCRRRPSWWARIHKHQANLGSNVLQPRMSPEPYQDRLQHPFHLAVRTSNQRG